MGQLIQWLEDMDWGNIGIPVLAIIVTAVFSYSADRKAKKANRIAIEAKNQSVRANEIANAALEVTKSDEYADWYVSFGCDNSTVSIWNVGTRKAYDVTLLLLDDNGTRKAWRFGDCDSNQRLTLPWPELKMQMEIRRKRDAYVYINDVTDQKAHWNVRLRVEWKDSLGKDRHWIQQVEID